MPWNGCEPLMSGRLSSPDSSMCSVRSRLVRCLAALGVCWILSSTVSAQLFIRSLGVLHDSVPLSIEYAHQGSLLPPLNVHCLCLRIPDDVEGKVLVEMLDVSPNGFANFMGYASRGRLWACFKSREVTINDGGMRFDGNRVAWITMRRPVDTAFR